ncbi:MAG: hypothetical protein V1919_02590 [Candidatus Omnitrophota bacterium]
MRGVKVFKVICGLILFIMAASPVWANIVMKVISVNPSKQQSQKVAVKAYLPKEVKPEHIISKDDLEVGYDNQQGSYYVFGEYELKPDTTLEKIIELSDIWVIPAAEMETLRLEVENTVKNISVGEFKERINFLKQSIDSKLKEIQEKQDVEAVNPEKHISDYRDNLKLLESVKADLVVLRNLLAQSKAFTPVTIWKLFFVIVGSLGVLAFIFNVIWQVHLRRIYKSGLVPLSSVRDELKSNPIIGKENNNDPPKDGE